jgi:arabinose-5-phosphate isomerase
LEARNFSSEDFAQFHPGGALGKRLYLRVSDIYPSNSNPQVGLDATLKSLIIEISSKRLGATAVVDDNHELIGLITDGDLRRMLEREEDLSAIKARDLMTRDPKVVHKDDYAVKALRIMQENDITQVIVIENKKVLGFVHLHDLLKEGLI